MHSCKEYIVLVKKIEDGDGLRGSDEKQARRQQTIQTSQMEEQMSPNSLVPDDRIHMPHEKNTTPQQNPFQFLITPQATSRTSSRTCLTTGQGHG